MELGPQGGHHVWIAARMQNIKQAGSTTKITALQPGGGATVAPTAFIFTFDVDEGGWCKLAGLRFQLDVGALDLKTVYKQFLGKPLDITVEVSDSNGDTASDTKHVLIAPQVLCPDGGLSADC
jgi:hypothetical protein